MILRSENEQPLYNIPWPAGIGQARKDKHYETQAVMRRRDTAVPKNSLIRKVRHGIIKNTEKRENSFLEKIIWNIGGSGLRLLCC